MRVRILKHSSGILNGVSLSALLPGLVYEVPPSIGSWLISEKAAEEDVRPTVGIVVPLDQAPAALIGGVSVVPPPDKADDRRPRRTRRRPKR